MFKEVFKLESILGLSRWALVIFVLVFVAMTIWTWTRSKKHIDRWAALPLDDSPPDPNKSKQGARS